MTVPIACSQDGLMVSGRPRSPLPAQRALRSPDRPDGLIRRDRLLAKLAAIAESRVSLVVAPAGAGKSVLLRQHAAHTGEVLLSAAGNTTAAGFAARFGAALGGDAAGVPSVLDLLDRAVATGPVVAHVDDVDKLTGTPAATVLAEL